MFLRTEYYLWCSFNSLVKICICASRKPTLTSPVTHACARCSFFSLYHMGRPVKYPRKWFKANLQNEKMDRIETYEYIHIYKVYKIYLSMYTIIDCHVHLHQTCQYDETHRPYQALYKVVRNLFVRLPLIYRIIRCNYYYIITFWACYVTRIFNNISGDNEH